MDATNQDQQRAAVRTALIFVHVLGPSASGSANGAQLAHAFSASHCLLTDWRPTA